MPVDLSATIHAQFLKARQRGEKLEAEGKDLAAAEAYQRAADLMRRYADYTHDNTVRGSRLKNARFYQHLAQNMRGETIPPGSSGKSRPQSQAEGQQSSLEKDDYTGEILSLIQKPKVSWEDIGGLEETKRLIKTAYGLALARKPAGLTIDSAETMLLYGPPGTGKTLLAAATAGNLEATFFNVKVSNLLSKYFGESTKLISALYEVAREKYPSVVFLDEFEALVPARGSADSGAERRIVSTLLAELDGLAGKDDDRFVLSMAATNLPWLLDSAILSRFQRKVYVPLPDEAAREEILRIHTEKKGHKSQVPLSELITKSAGYSGREIEQVCEIAAANMVSRMNPDLIERVEAGLSEIQAYQLKAEPLTREDFKFGFDTIKPMTSRNVLNNYETWSGNAA